jgi:hypothetical protein
MPAADVGKGIAAVGARQQSEGEQERERAEARHDQIDVSRADVIAGAMMRHDQRPRRQRHEFPRHQKREGVVGEHHDAHAGEKRRIERQHPARGILVATVSEREQTGRRRAEIDHSKEKGRQRIETEMRSKPRDSQWQGGDRGTSRKAEQSEQRDREQRQRRDQTNAVDDEPRAQHRRSRRQARPSR